MTLLDFKAIVLRADPKSTKRFGAGKGNYTVWTPGAIDRVMSDDENDEKVQRIYVDRYTKIDDDPIVQAIWDELEKAFISFEYEQDTETDTKIIHHIFTCFVQV